MTMQLQLIDPAHPGDLDACRDLRTQVFVTEQGIARAIELDERDTDCTHLLLTDPDGVALATGRLLPEGRIGRMAVASEQRGYGLGRVILEGLMAIAASRGLQRVSLHAQHGAVDFYRRAGFTACGDDFIEAGILHTPMERVTDEAPADLDTYLRQLPASLSLQQA